MEKCYFLALKVVNLFKVKFYVYHDTTVLLYRAITIRNLF